ncbi:hypothetical protein GCM10012275_55810 [Longimycelium tulufanense]|uniref:Uncharacterized protein n=1 Tax=Longimycelium tulufanense TaxID=907463 RepID=A0A8J3CHX1_9PSEU|nr:hypothetical protein [Longimycelium tulufanense]GGM77999.1 hypothetical protein GCM10012275_55810 [Longimycelium tulufanense]
MDEVRVLTRAGERIGHAVGTGVHQARLSAAQVGRRSYDVSRRMAAQAATRTRERLAEGNRSGDVARQVVAGKQLKVTSADARRAYERQRKRIMRQMKDQRKRLAELQQDLSRAAEAADVRGRKVRRQLARQSRRMRRDVRRALRPRARRRWPWVLALLVAAGAAVAAVLAQRPQETELDEQPEVEVPYSRDGQLRDSEEPTSVP